MFLVFIVVIFFEGLTSVLVFTLFHYQNRAKISIVRLSYKTALPVLFPKGISYSSISNTLWAFP